MNYKSLQARQIPLNEGYTAETNPYANAFKQKQAEYDQAKTEKKDKAVEGLSYDDPNAALDKQIANVEQQIKDTEAAIARIDAQETERLRAKGSESMSNYKPNSGTIMPNDATMKPAKEFQGYGN